ncbi:MAG: hypothetical protein ACJ8CR_26010 [Roseiflexaceae bacterium]
MVLIPGEDYSEFTPIEGLRQLQEVPSMFIASFFRVRTIAAVAVALVLTTAAYAFAAANTVDVSGAGDGSGAISGYTISDQTYTLDPADPTEVDSMTFTATPLNGAPPATVVKVSFDAGVTWTTVGAPVGGIYTITFAGGTTVSSLTSMEVVATGVGAP